MPHQLYRLEDRDMEKWTLMLGTPFERMLLHFPLALDNKNVNAEPSRGSTNFTYYISAARLAKIPYSIHPPTTLRNTLRREG